MRDRFTGLFQLVRLFGITVGAGPLLFHSVALGSILRTAYDEKDSGRLHRAANSCMLCCWFARWLLHEFAHCFRRTVTCHCYASEVLLCPLVGPGQCGQSPSTAPLPSSTAAAGPWSTSDCAPGRWHSPFLHDHRSTTWNPLGYPATKLPGNIGLTPWIGGGSKCRCPPTVRPVDGPAVLGELHPLPGSTS